MNQLDFVREEMKKRGCSAAVRGSKAIPIVLDILSGSTDFTALSEIEETIKEKRQELWQLERIESDIEEKRKQFEREKSAFKTYLEEFNAALLNAETPEARDALRTAQTYINAVRIDTKYDNTAFIKGLAAILARSPLSSELNLETIDPKHFEKERKTW